MDAINIMELSGLSTKDIGSMSAMAPVPFRPGMAPKMMPIATPPKVKSRFSGVNSVDNTLAAIVNALVAFSIKFSSPFENYFIDVIEVNELDILVNPINTNGIIKYPTNRHTIGVNPIAFPIIPFLFINLSFDSFLFS